MVHWSSVAARECFCSSSPPAETTRLLDSVDEVGRGLEDEESEALPASVVQFSSAQFFCTEEEGHATVDVVRLGDASGSAWCSYRTEDGSAKAGLKYIAQKGELEFASGETQKTISIPLLMSTAWDSTLEFSVVLTKVSRARRGQYLNRCLVSVIDDDAFPTNKFGSEAQDKEQLNAVSGIALMMEYVRMNFTNKSVRNTTLLFLVLDQISNLYFLLTVYLQMYLVDVVLGGEEEPGEGGEEHAERRLLLEGIHAGGRVLARLLGEEEAEEPLQVESGELLVPGSRHYTAVVVGLLYVIPFAVTHTIDIAKIKMGLSGSLRKLLQTALMRKFLTFREDVFISDGDLSMAMTRDILEVVNFGYMKLIALSCVVGRLSYAMIFILHENTLAAVPLSVFLVIGGIFLFLREPSMVHTNEEMARAENKLVHFVHDVIANEHLVSDFNLRPYIIKRYESSITEFNDRFKHVAMIMTNNSYLPEWITTVLLGGYMVYGTSHVVSMGGTLSLGAYLATLNIFKEVGAEMAEIYMEVMEVLKVTGPLRTITFFMNQPTFLPSHMQRNRKRRVLGKERRLAARSTFTGATAVARTDDGKFVFAVDTMKIELENVSFSYGHRTLLDRVNVSFSQGQLYAFVGHEQSGKSTLLRVLAGGLLPKDGDAFVPPHLRMLHVCREPLYLNGSLLSNIVFQNDLEHVGGVDRVRRICNRCGFTAEALRLLGDETEPEGGESTSRSAAWAQSFSSTDFAKLSFARALVMNPECLVMQMPLIAFGDVEARKMLELMRSHIDERGLELSEVGRKYRRPRTVFFSSSTLHRCARADTVFEVSREQGVRELPASARQEAMVLRGY